MNKFFYNSLNLDFQCFMVSFSCPLLPVLCYCNARQRVEEWDQGVVQKVCNSLQVRWAKCVISFIAIISMESSPNYSLPHFSKLGGIALLYTTMVQGPWVTAKNRGIFVFPIGLEWSQGTLALNCYLLYVLCSWSPILKDLVGPHVFVCKFVRLVKIIKLLTMWLSIFRILSVFRGISSSKQICTAHADGILC